jgi:hypothetical protein
MFAPPPVPSPSNPLAAAAALGPTAKVTITPKEGSGKPIEFSHNPTSMSLSRSATWKDVGQGGSSSTHALVQYDGSKSDTLSFTVLVDTSEDFGEQAKGVQSRIKEIFNLMVPSEDKVAGANDAKRPPIVEVVLADFKFLGYVSSCDVTYLVLAKGGEPIRAELALSFGGVGFPSDVKVNDPKAFFTAAQV